MGVFFPNEKPYFENVNMSGRLNTHTISILKRETVIAISLDMHVLSKWTELNEE